MATKSTDYLQTYFDITPYQHEAASDQTFDTLSVSVAYRKGQGFVTYYHPGWSTNYGGYGCVMLSGTKDPLVEGHTMLVKEASRNNSKELRNMLESLKQAEEGIRAYFDAREFFCLDKFLVAVCRDGYTPEYVKQVHDFMDKQNNDNNDNNSNDTTMATTKQTNNESANVQAAAQVNNESPMMKHYRELKEKNLATVLLFRSGDFYEAFDVDARACSEVLGITLTFRDFGQHVDYTAFPADKLDTYLPKLIRAGKRCAICDQLEGAEQAGELAKRGVTEAAAKQDETIDVGPHKVDVEGLMNSLSTNGQAKLSDHIAQEDKPEVSSDLPEVQFSIYKTKKGNVAPQIIGFESADDPRYKRHKDAGHKWVSASWRKNINGEKVYVLLFGTRYMDAAKALVEAYNSDDREAWKQAESIANGVYEQAKADGKAKWEAKKAEWAEKRAARQTAAPAEPRYGRVYSGKIYSEQDVINLLAAVRSGDADAMAKVQALLEKVA